jgi:hypothetical protein
MPGSCALRDGALDLDDDVDEVETSAEMMVADVAAGAGRARRTWSGTRRRSAEGAADAVAQVADGVADVLEAAAVLGEENLAPFG